MNLWQNFRVGSSLTFQSNMAATDELYIVNEEDEYDEEGLLKYYFLPGFPLLRNTDVCTESSWDKDEYEFTEKAH